MITVIAATPLMTITGGIATTVTTALGTAIMTVTGTGTPTVIRAGTRKTETAVIATGMIPEMVDTVGMIETGNTETVIIGTIIQRCDREPRAGI